MTLSKATEHGRTHNKRNTFYKEKLDQLFNQAFIIAESAPNPKKTHIQSDMAKALANLIFNWAAHNRIAH